MEPRGTYFFGGIEHYDAEYDPDEAPELTAERIKQLEHDADGSTDLEQASTMIHEAGTLRDQLMLHHPEAYQRAFETELQD